MLCMTIHQEHFGRKFYQDKKTGYWISTDHPRIRAHRWVWVSTYGNIPHGYHIHHKNENKSDNDIKNLELIELSRHLSYHMQDPERIRFASENCNRIRPLTKAWHASEEGRTWHKSHGILGWIKRKEITISCKCCLKETKTKTYHQEFCSNNCKSQWRRDQGIDNIEKKCERCSKFFIVNKFCKQKFCSKNCLQSIKILLKPQIRSLRDEGLTYQEIGEKLNISRKEASDLCKV